jgi:hypothetical protein
MDPHKGSVLQNILTVGLYVILSVAYFFMKLTKEKTKFVDPSHLYDPREEPISSLDLAKALNPKTDQNRIKRLVKSKDPFIRRAVARNPSLSSEDLNLLAQDPDSTVAGEAQMILNQEKVSISSESPI